MSIFGTRRESETATQPTPTAPSRAAPRPKPSEPTSRDRTQIATGSQVVGEISGSAELVVDGRVQGKIDLGSRLVVGPKGRVEGEVTARSIQISGQVHGNVQGLERVEVLASGRLEGDLESPQVHIAEGAFFTGKVEMKSRPDTKDKKREAPRVKEPPRPAPPSPEPEAANLAGASHGPGPGISDKERGDK